MLLQTVLHGSDLATGRGRGMRLALSRLLVRLSRWLSFVGPPLFRSSADRLEDKGRESRELANSQTRRTRMYSPGVRTTCA